MTGPDLGGWRVVVTREAERAGELEAALAAAGASPVLVPVLETVAPADGGAELVAALAHPGRCDWLLLTSAATVTAVAARLGPAGWPGPVAVVGPATAVEARRAGLEPSLALDGSVATAAALATRLVAEHPAGRAVAPGSDLARAEGVAVLRAAGWRVDTVTAYRTVAVVPSPAALARARGAHAITFLSPSAVEAWSAVAATPPPLVVTIGPTTSRQAARRGLAVAAEAAERTVQGVVGALAVLARSGPPPLPGSRP